VRRETQLEENMKTAYLLVWRQCSDMMRQRIETYNAYSEISTTGDVIALHKIIKGINYNFQSQKHVPVSLHEAKKRFYGCYQAIYQSIQATFQNNVDVIAHIGCSIGLDPAMFTYAAEELGKEVSELSEQDKEKARNQYIATALILGADRSRFGKLIDKMQNDYLQGYNSYPKSMAAAMNLMVNWKQESNQTNGTVLGSNAASFVTNGNSNNPQQNSRNGRAPTQINITCYQCGAIGHYASACPQGLMGTKNANEARRDTSQNGNSPAENGMLTTGVLNDDITEQMSFVFNTVNNSHESIPPSCY
jgi:Zinc knuckle